MNRSLFFRGAAAVWLAWSATGYAQLGPGHSVHTAPTREMVLSSSEFGVGHHQEIRLELGRRYFVWSLRVNVESNSWGDAAGELWVNGEKRGDVYAPQSRPDPAFFIPVERESDAITIIGRPVTGAQGRLRVMRVVATVSETRPQESPSGYHPTCAPCREMGMPFPTYYRTVMGNVSNQAIILVDRLMQFTNYNDLGQYLLPIKKAAAESRSLAEARGDASAYARPYYEKLLRTLDDSQMYLDDLYERPGVFQLATELLSLREYIRRVLN